jgi:hypothetical protein
MCGLPGPFNLRLSPLRSPDRAVGAEAKSADRRGGSAAIGGEYVGPPSFGRATDRPVRSREGGVALNSHGRKIYGRFHSMPDIFLNHVPHREHTHEPIVSAYDRSDDLVGLPQAQRWLVMVPRCLPYFGGW